MKQIGLASHLAWLKNKRLFCADGATEAPSDLGLDNLHSYLHVQLFFSQALVQADIAYAGCHGRIKGAFTLWGIGLGKCIVQMECCIGSGTTYMTIWGIRIPRRIGGSSGKSKDGVSPRIFL